MPKLGAPIPVNYLWEEVSSSCVVKGTVEVYRNAINSTAQVQGTIESQKNFSRNIALDQIIKASLGCGQVILKFDIEGAEYECLSSTFPQIYKLTGLIIEFHSVP